MCNVKGISFFKNKYKQANILIPLIEIFIDNIIYLFIYRISNIFVCFFLCSGTSNDEMCNFYIMYYMDSEHANPFMNCMETGSKDLFRHIPAEANVPIAVSPDHMSSMMHGGHSSTGRKSSSFQCCYTFIYCLTVVKSVHKALKVLLCLVKIPWSCII